MQGIASQQSSSQKGEGGCCQNTESVERVLNAIATECVGIGEDIWNDASLCAYQRLLQSILEGRCDIDVVHMV